jgi:hypothetical protein
MLIADVTQRQERSTHLTATLAPAPGGAAASAGEMRRKLRKIKRFIHEAHEAAQRK